MNKFYEAQQKAGSGWSSVGFFTTKKAAKEYIKKLQVILDHIIYSYYNQK